MDHAKFSILEAARSAYAFIWRERAYLLRLALLPVLLQAATSFFIAFARSDASALEACLWGLPSTFAYAWFAFVEARLLLLGERVGSPATAQPERRRTMAAALILAVLFNMGFTLIAVVIGEMADTLQKTPKLAISFAELFLIGAAFWALRLAVLPIAAAVGFPLRVVLKRVSGLMFSFRLLAMAFVCVLPVQIALAAVFELTGVDLRNVTPQTTAILLAGAAPFSLLFTALLTAGAVHALRSIIGKAAP